jgi:uncharacterized protein YecE (DUF72 family)
VSGATLVGTIGYPISRERVQRAVDVVELSEGRELPPAASTARRWRRRAPEGLSFCAPASRFLHDRPPPGAPLEGDPEAYGRFRLSDENLALWKRCLDFAGALEAEALVIVTPPELTPAAIAVDRFAAFVGAVDRDGKALVWEPHGPWEPERAAALAERHELVLAVDPLRDEPPPGPLAYLRLGPMAAFGSRMGLYDLERIAETAERFESTICVFGTERALDDARNLKRIIAGEDLAPRF